MALFILPIFHSEIKADASYKLPSVELLWKIPVSRGSLSTSMSPVAEGACNSQVLEHQLRGARAV